MQGKKTNQTQTTVNYSMTLLKHLLHQSALQNKCSRNHILTLQPHSNLCLFSQLTCKEKNLSQCGPCTTCFSSWSRETEFLSFSHLKCPSVCMLHTRLYPFSFQTVLTFLFHVSSLYALGNFKFPISCWELHSTKPWISTMILSLLHFSER